MAKKTHAEYLQQLQDKHQGRITCLGTYEKGNIAIEHYCHTCNQIWLAKPENLTRTRASGCRLCAENKVMRTKRTPESYQTEIDTIHNGRVIAIEPYQRRKTPILHKCMACDHEWTTQPANVIYGSGCPACNNVKKKKNLRIYAPPKTHKQYIKDVERVHFDTITVLETYKDNLTKIRHLCNQCDHIWLGRPDHIVRRRGCPSCNQSHGEKLIANILRKQQIAYKVEHTFDDLCYKNKLRFDFYLPNKNVLIEYDGEQHYKPVKHFNGNKGYNITKKRDALKNRYAKQKGIQLIRIPYWKKPEEIEAMLINTLEPNQTKNCM